jgi:hypothetical protein
LAKYQISKSFVFSPFVDYFWNYNQNDIFLNESQEERAFSELQRFEEKIHFEISNFSCLLNKTGKIFESENVRSGGFKFYVIVKIQEHKRGLGIYLHCETDNDKKYIHFLINNEFIEKMYMINLGIFLGVF